MELNENQEQSLEVRPTHDEDIMPLNLIELSDERGRFDDNFPISEYVSVSYDGVGGMKCYQMTPTSHVSNDGEHYYKSIKVNGTVTFSGHREYTNVHAKALTVRQIKPYSVGRSARSGVYMIMSIKCQWNGRDYKYLRIFNTWFWDIEHGAESEEIGYLFLLSRVFGTTDARDRSVVVSYGNFPDTVISLRMAYNVFDDVVGREVFEVKEIAENEENNEVIELDENIVNLEVNVDALVQVASKFPQNSRGNVQDLVSEVLQNAIKEKLPKVVDSIMNARSSSYYWYK